MSEIKSLKADVKRVCAEMAVYLAQRFPAADFIIIAEGQGVESNRPDAVLAASDGYCCLRRIAKGLSMAASMARQAADERGLPECFDTEGARPS